MVTPRPSTYAVSLPVFEGPLDLLLSLIEREQLDITSIALAQVTDQFLAYLETLDERRVGELADFLVVAAKLLLIKSLALLPRPPEPQVSEAEDVGQELVAQLHVYRRFKEIAALLGEREARGLRSYVRMVNGARNPALAARPLELDLSGVSVEDLLRAVQEALQAVPAPPVDTVVRPIVVTVADQIGRIERYLRRRQRLLFSRLLSRVSSRLEIIVTLQAVLEMIKQGTIQVRQECLFGEIIIERPPAEVAATDAVPAPSTPA
jgi:segregation and condensation protein A